MNEILAFVGRRRTKRKEGSKEGRRIKTLANSWEMRGDSDFQYELCADEITEWRDDPPETQAGPETTHYKVFKTLSAGVPLFCFLHCQRPDV